MKCAACGFALNESDRVCPACGAPHAGSLPSPLPTPFPQPSAPASAAPPLPKPSGPSTSLSARQIGRVAAEQAGLGGTEVLSGRYRLEQKIGEGGMGVVFTAHDLELDRLVAVKVLSAAMVNDVEVVERFEREARLTAKLDHPNIVPIFDVGRHEGRPFIVMKLLEGSALVDLLRAKGGLSPQACLQLMKQLAAGLDFIHRQGFIHRDIKAGNIFVAPDGRAWILDFGILRPRSSTGGITRAGMVMGTPHYMAPEQALGLKDVDHRVDLYALAVVLFECLSGTLPFEADSELRLIQMHAHSPPPDILDRAPWVAKPVATVMRKALAKRPEDRFNSATELVQAFEEALGDAERSPPVMGPEASASGPPARPLGPSGHAPKVPSSVGAPPRRRWWLSGLMVLVLGTAAAVWRLWPATGLVSPGAADASVEVTLGPEAGAWGPSEDAGLALARAADAGSDEDAELDGGLAIFAPDAGRRLGNPLNLNAKRKGQLTVVSNHAGEAYWAQVFVDGVPRGRTPLKLELSAGTYRVSVERAGFRTESREVRVVGAKQVVVRFELRP